MAAQTASPEIPDKIWSSMEASRFSTPPSSTCSAAASTSAQLSFQFPTYSPVLSRFPYSSGQVAAASHFR